MMLEFYFKRLNYGREAEPILRPKKLSLGVKLQRFTIHNNFAILQLTFPDNWGIKRVKSYVVNQLPKKKLLRILTGGGVLVEDYKIDQYKLLNNGFWLDGGSFTYTKSL